MRLWRKRSQRSGRSPSARTWSALDVVNGVNNIAKRLAEAGVEIKKLGVKGAKEGWTGFRVNFPKQTKKLGAALAKLAVWGPL